VTGRAVGAAALIEHSARILARLGARDGHAVRVAEALVGADLAGHASHGVRQLPYYAGQIRRGELDVASDWTVAEDAGSRLVVDGGYGFGHVIAGDAARLAGERSARDGVAVVAVRNANHIGRIGEYTEALARDGHIAIMLVDNEGSSPQLAPFGGIDRRLTNNPISFAVPGPDHPIMLDMALSAVAESKVLHALERDVAVPDGWLLDADGRPSTDPRAYVDGGTLVPVGGTAGGHKGYALIVVVELIVGMLTGGRICGPGDPRFSNGFVIIAVNPGERGTRRADVSALVDWVKSSRLREGFDEILVPGEVEERARRQNGRVVMLDHSTAALLDELARSLGIEGSL
jgi:uncharacterized oxidoreductase